MIFLHRLGVALAVLPCFAAASVDIEATLAAHASTIAGLQLELQLTRSETKETRSELDALTARVAALETNSVTSTQASSLAVPAAGGRRLFSSELYPNVTRIDSGSVATSVATVMNLNVLGTFRWHGIEWAPPDPTPVQR